MEPVKQKIEAMLAQATIVSFGRAVAVCRKEVAQREAKHAKMVAAVVESYQNDQSNSHDYCNATASVERLRVKVSAWLALVGVGWHWLALFVVGSSLVHHWFIIGSSLVHHCASLSSSW